MEKEQLLQQFQSSIDWLISTLVKPIQARRDLSRSVTILSQRGLHIAANWSSIATLSLLSRAAELAVSIDDADESALLSAPFAPESTPDDEKIMLARTRFEMKEYRRAASALAGCASDKVFRHVIVPIMHPGMLYPRVQSVPRWGETTGRGAT